jgi:RimJ/RimL family protein N-acetyltransferase
MSKNGTTIIHRIQYQYQILNIQELNMFFKEHQILKKSYEELIKSYKPQYDLKQLEKDAKVSKLKKTYFFIIHNQQQVIFNLRFVFYDKSFFSYLDFIVVHQDYRNKKIGTKCVNLFLYKTKNDFNIYELKVRNDNMGAIKCYMKNQFKKIKVIQQKKDNGFIDVLIMRLYISHKNKLKVHI